MSYTRLYVCCLCGVSFKDVMPVQSRCPNCGGYVKVFVLEPQPHYAGTKEAMERMVRKAVFPDMIPEEPLPDSITERFAGIDFGAKPSFAEEAMSALSKEILSAVHANDGINGLGPKVEEANPLETLETAALLAELQRRAGK